jgi:hypothetical protein
MAGTKAPLFGYKPIGKGLWFACGIITEEGHHGPKLGGHRPGLVFFPIGDCISRDPHSSGRLPPKEAEFTAPLLEMLPQCLGRFQVIP